MASNENGWVHRGTREASYVSGRFLTDFLEALERRGVSATELIGDLPIPIPEFRASPNRITVSRVEWPDFVEFMKRLERSVGGSAEIEACGAAIDQLKPASALRGLAGLTASPLSLYRAATRWALQRAIPGIETEIRVVDENHIEIRAELREGMRGCPQIFHFAAGGARALPRILGLQDALVDADIGPTAARYRVTLPPSPTLFARARRFTRTLFSAGSVLRVLESQQLELHAEHEALQRAHSELAENQERYRAFADATVDVLCELDANGHIAFISASIEDLLGYTPNQVTGSHFRLWVPTRHHRFADARFKTIASQSPGKTLPRINVSLHSVNGNTIVAELSLRSFENADGDWRLACVVRELSDAVSERVTRPEAESRIDRLGRSLATYRDQNSKREPENEPRHILHPAIDHPLEDSLGRLIAALEAYSCNDAKGKDSNAANELIRASDAMTRIVDCALVEAEGELLPAQWVETQKLMDRIQHQANAISGSHEVEIRFRAESLPTRLRVREDLLVIGLSKLLESSCQVASETNRIVLSVMHGLDSEATPSLEFSIETLLKSSETDIAEHSNAEPRIGSPDVLSIAIATDAAKAHGGELLIEPRKGGGSASRLRIPIPD